MIDAVLANDRTVYLFVGAVPATSCPRASRPPTTWRGFGRVRNTLADTGRVDASFVRGEHTFLFSGDQYVRYTGGEYEFVDEGYPRRIAASLPGELVSHALPEQFQDGLDAALADADGQVYLFRGRQFVSDVEPAPAPQPIVGIWGRVRNLFVADPYDAGDRRGIRRPGTAACSRSRATSTCATERPRPSSPTTATHGRSRTTGGTSRRTSRDGLDAAFVFEGDTYFVQGESTCATPAATSAGSTARIRSRSSGGGAGGRTTCSPISAPSPGSSSCRTGRRRPAAWPRCWAPTVVTADPYGRLAGLFGWDVDELMWVQRHHGFLPASRRVRGRSSTWSSSRRPIELFALAAPLGGSAVDRLHRRVDAAVRPRRRRTCSGRAADGLRRLLALRHPEAEWAAIERQLHDELNVVTRDALVAAVLAQSGDLSTSRDLFDRCSSTSTWAAPRPPHGCARPSPPRSCSSTATSSTCSRSRSGPATTRPADPEAVKAELRRWWDWMKNYRVWEANRKVYLYPENYLRPELRDTKTPAFAALEDDLLQGEITPASAERAYRRYLDEYTEVSRLTIAGGYVHEPEDDDDLPWHLVLFGRTKTDPRRYYYRLAEFSREASRSAQWHPWLKVERPDRQRPGLPRPSPSTGCSCSGRRSRTSPTPTPTVSFTEHDGQRDAVAHRRVADHARRQDLLLVLQPQQGMGAGAGADHRAPDPGHPADLGRPAARRAVAASADSAGDGDGSARRGPRDHRRPVLVHDPGRRDDDRAADRRLRNSARSCTRTPAVPVSFDDSGADRFTSIFDEDVARNGACPHSPRAAARSRREVAAMVAAPAVVMFNKPAESSEGPWFSFDYKGGSFLCKTAAAAGRRTSELLPVSGGQERLPDWERFDAAFTARAARPGTSTPAASTSRSTRGAGPAAPRPVARPVRPRRATRSPRTVWWTPCSPAVGTPTCSRAPQYFRYSGEPFGVLDDWLPEDARSRTRTACPGWRRVDAAFTVARRHLLLLLEGAAQASSARRQASPAAAGRVRRRSGAEDDRPHRTPRDGPRPGPRSPEQDARRRPGQRR